MGVFRFQLFGFPVHIMPGFWGLLALLGLSQKADITQGVIVALVAFASVIAHELGHALAARRFGLTPQITLHMMGGATVFAPGPSLSRARDIAISAAGPASGLLLAAASWFLYTLYAPAGDIETGSAFLLALFVSSQINLVWSVLNLVPVMPFDGGRILVAAMGPTRRPLAAGISLTVGLLAGIALLKIGFLLAGLLVGWSGVQSYLRMKAPPSSPVEVTPHALTRALRAAREALSAEQFQKASMLAQGIAGSANTQSQRIEALEILLWARLGAEDPTSARAVLKNIASDELDAYVVAAVHEATGHLHEAQAVLVQARGRGDQRAEVTAFLVKVLLKLESFAGAATVALDALGALDAGDVRQVIAQAAAGGADPEAARLSLELAKSAHSFDDAERATLLFAGTDDTEQALAAFQFGRECDAEKSRQLLEKPELTAVREMLSKS